MNGRRLQLTWRELQAQFRHPLFVGMMLMMALCIVVIGPYDHLLNFAPLRLTIFYAACFGSFTGLLYFALWLCHSRAWRAYSLFTVGSACIGSTICGLTAALLLGAPVPSAPDMLLVTGFNLVFCYLGETLQSTFIIPRILADLRGRKPQDMLAEFIASDAGAVTTALTPPVSDTLEAPEVVTIFGQRLLARTIHLIEAEEHYIALTLHDGAQHLLRGRIADAVTVMPPHLGRQVHRSYWVAAAAVAGFHPDKSGAHLALISGRTVPVARPRLAEVRRWAEGVLADAATARVADKKKAPQRVPFRSS